MAMDDGAAVECGALEEAVIFLSYFKDLPDHRQAGKVTYPLDEVLLLSLLAVLAGAETFVDIARFGTKKLALLRRFRPFADGRIARSSRRYLRLAMLRHSSTVRLGSRADRRGSRRDRDRRQDISPYLRQEERQGLYPLVSAFAARQRLVLGQVKVGESTRSRHPQASRHAGDRRGHRHHRRDGVSA
jgi:hypothetical protein